MGEKINPILRCHYCGHTGADYTIKEVGPHTAAHCADCGIHIKFLSKQDKYGTKEQQAEIWRKTGGACAYCGDMLNPFEKNGFSYDHIAPQSSGGGHETENLHLACKSCNSQKGPKTLAQYRQYLASKNGKPTWIFYFEVLLYSKMGQREISLF